MFGRLPAELLSLVFDFYGDTSILRHRLRRFVLIELDCLFQISVHYGRRLRPSTVPRVEAFKEALQTAYLQAQRKTLLEDHGGSVIP